MISHEKRFVFVHIPRTGGTSVARALACRGVCLQGEQNFDSLYFKHATAADIKRMMGTEFDDYFTFTVVRNPWDWVVSNYLFNRGLHRPWVRATDYTVWPGVPPWAADWRFPQWLRWWIDTFGPQQSRMLTGTDGRMLVNRVLRFEDLAAEFPRLCRQLRMPLARLRHDSQRTERQPYADYFDDESRGLVDEHFKEDIDRFGYSFAGASVTPEPDVEPDVRIVRPPIGQL